MKQASKVDPTEWARKKKMAMDKAKAIREERKGGIRDEAHTFKPQINARPSYLDDTPQHDALDDLAANYDTNDIFEKPLPGKKSYGLDPSAAPTYGNMSPGSDALGTEMRKHSPRNSCSNIYQSNSRQSSGSNMKESSYQDTASSYSKASDSEATESFMNNLRSDGSFKSKSKKPGWNEDFTSAGVIDSYSRPPAVPIVKKTAVESTISPRNNLRPPVNAASKSTSQRGISSRSEWDNDFTTHQSDRMNDLPPQPSQQKLSPNSEQAKVITHARSRLSLLKSKIRQSESSGSARFSETYSSDENADDTPRTAPITRNNSSSFSNKQEMPSQTSQYMKKPNQSLQMQDESMNRGRMGANEGRVGNSRTNSQATIDTSISPMSGTPRRSAGGGYSSFNDVPSNIEIDRDRGHLPPRVSKETSSFSMANDSPDMEEDIIIGEQVECPDCGRKFNPSSFQKHAKICAKVFLQKRKVFDSKKMRVADNPELVKIIKKVEKEGKSKKNTKPSEVAKYEDQAVGGNNDKAKWKEQSNAFRDAMRQARLVSKAIAEGAPLPPPKISAPDSSLILCPHCGRRFNANAAERHIPKCTSILAKPTALKKGSNHSAAALALKGTTRGAKF